MIHLKRVALEIKTVGLYDLILQDVLKIADKKRVSEDEILEIIKENPAILDEYKQINVEYNLSNIHLRDIDTQNLGCISLSLEVLLSPCLSLEHLFYTLLLRCLELYL